MSPGYLVYGRREMCEKSFEVKERIKRRECVTHVGRVDGSVGMKGFEDRLLLSSIQAYLRYCSSLVFLEKRTRFLRKQYDI